MKKSQWITVGIAAVLTVVIFLYGRTVPEKKHVNVETHSEHDGHDHGAVANSTFSIDSVLLQVKKRLSPEQVTRISMLENSISRGNVKQQQLEVYHQLSHFWGDSMRYFEPYAWYEAEAARLENSEKTLTFAAHLFLNNLQEVQDPVVRKWEALQAKDLFERSLKINPDNDSSKVGLGACYLFGGISEAPMEGIQKIREVVEKDSTNVYAQMMLAKGSLLSGQFDKAITRLQTVNRIEPANVDAILMLADVYERTGKKALAADWYQKSLAHIPRADVRAEVEKRIKELKK